MINKTKIDWCDYTWNPVWGCRNNCSYCYARKIAKRIARQIANKEINYLYSGEERPKEWLELYKKLKNFEPTFLYSNFDRAFPKKPSRIFVDSMSDICWWDREWMHRVLDKIKKHPEHIFQFLTKTPSIYSCYVFPLNCWLGTTITDQSMMDAFADLIFDTTWDDEDYTIFLSFEPLLERIEFYISPDWVIIGAETGNRKGKIIPKRECITEIVDYCQFVNIPVFLKDSLKEIWGKELIQEYPM